MRKKIWIAALILGIAAGSLTGCRIGNTQYVIYEQKVDSKTVFTVNDLKCSLKEAKIYLCNYKNIYGNAYGLNLWDTGDYQDSLEDYVKDVAMAELTRVICMDLLAQEQGIELDEEETAKIAELAKAYYESLTEEERDFMDVRTSDIQQAYEHYAVAMKLYATLTDGVNEEVSDDEARVVRLQQIYVTDADIAQTVAQKLANGEDFASVAAAYNRTTSVEVIVARGDYPEEVEDVAFNLDDGAISAMIETDNGYYFVKCLNRFEEELTEANKANILIRREKEQFDDLYEEFLKTCEFEGNDTLWDEVSFEGTTGITTDSFFALYDSYFTE
jgi:foldase protein PrsA